MLLPLAIYRIAIFRSTEFYIIGMNKNLDMSGLITNINCLDLKDLKTISTMWSCKTQRLTLHRKIGLCLISLISTFFCGEVDTELNPVVLYQ